MGIDRHKWVCIFGAGNLLKFSSKQFHPLNELAKLATESKDKGRGVEGLRRKENV